MNWDEAEARIRNLLTNVITIVRSKYPEIHAGIGAMVPAHMRFRMSASFARDRYGDTADLILPFSCAPSHAFRNADGSPKVSGDGDFVEFAIEDGWGKPIAALAPELLPGGPKDPSYQEAVFSYIDRVAAFLNDQMPTILEALGIGDTAR